MLENLPFSANILDAKKFVFDLEGSATHERIVLDYELDFYIKGQREMTINGDSFSVGKDTIVFRKPGDHIVSTGSYNCYLLTIDFTKKKGNFNGTYDRNNKSNLMQELSDNKLLDLIPSHLTVERCLEYVNIYEKLCHLSLKDGDQTTKTLLLNQLLCLILANICNSTLRSNTKETENFLLTETHKYVEKNIGKVITLEELSANVYLSSSWFSKKFKEATNISPMEYVLNIKLSNAKQLLSTTQLSINEIAQICGFNDAAYFSYYFKKRFGISPKQYRTQSTTSPLS